MSDPHPPTPSEDGRDEQLAALLEVEPLDELTRRRLVDTATRQGARRSWVKYAVAAAVVLGLAAGGTALLLGRSGDHPTAARPSVRRPGGALAPGVPSPFAGSAAGAVGLPVDLGDFGDLSDPGNLSRLRAAAGAASRASLAQRGAAELAGPLAAARACAHPSAPITAVATGTVRGRAAVALASGVHVTVVVLSPCEVRSVAP
jgi:hypothetical protein